MNKDDLIKYCKTDKFILHLLETTKTGETVTGGPTDIEFDLKQFAIITFGDDLFYSKIKNKEISKFISNKVIVLTAKEDQISVKELLDNLTKDGYKIIWTNNDYKYPNKPKSEIIRTGTSITLKIKKSYALDISYQELKKYYENRKNSSTHNTDLFFYLLSQNKDHKTIIDKNRFISDSVKLEDIRFNTNKVTFLFTCSNKYNEEISERNWAHSPISKKKSDRVQKQFEKGLFESIAKNIEEKIKSL